MTAGETVEFVISRGGADLSPSASALADTTPYLLKPEMIAFN
jgi:hypothetical protein